MEARFEVHYVDPRGLSKLRPILPSVIELVLVLFCLLVHQDYVLSDMVGLARLDTWDE